MIPTQRRKNIILALGLFTFAVVVAVGLLGWRISYNAAPMPSGSAYGVPSTQ